MLRTVVAQLLTRLAPSEECCRGVPHGHSVRLLVVDLSTSWIPALVKLRAHGHAVLRGRGTDRVDARFVAHRLEQALKRLYTPVTAPELHVALQTLAAFERLVDGPQLYRSASNKRFTVPPLTGWAAPPVYPAPRPRRVAPRNPIDLARDRAHQPRVALGQRLAPATGAARHPRRLGDVCDRNRTDGPGLSRRASSSNPLIEQCSESAEFCPPVLASRRS